MARDDRYDILFEPVRIGPRVMRNRFYQTPHASGLESQRPGAEAYFRGMKAEGGWAVVNTGHTQVAADFDYSGLLVPSQILDESDVRNWSLMTDRIHSAGSLAGIELSASGSRSLGYDSRLPARAVSGTADDVVPLGAAFEMDKRDIKRLQQDYVAAAKRARTAGFDIVNVHGAELWSVCSMFLMERYNHRTDEYGGTLENRARFWLETLERVRDAVGDDCAIAARHCIESLSGAGGIRIDEEGLGFVALADDLVDFWDVQVGGGSRDVGASRFFKENHQEEWIRRVRAHTAKPIVAVGRFTSPDTMVAVLKSGQQDIIGAARSSISDPFLPAKLEEGRIDEIRECIGCNVCVSRVNAASRVVCTQNPTTGEEYRRGWHPERFVRTDRPEKSVLVVGGGPAGLECAITLARQGVEYVHLVEAAREVGGHLRWVPRLPGLAEWIRVIDYRKIVAEKLRNLALIANKPMTVEEILDYGAKRVVIATGAQWAGDGLNCFSQAPIPGADATRDCMFTPEQIMVDRSDVPGDRVLLYDCDGYFVGPSLAEALALQGKHVTLVTPFDIVGPYLQWTEEHELMVSRLLGLNVNVVTGHVVERFEDGRASGHLRAYAERRGTWDNDAVVLVTQRIPNATIYRELISDRDALANAGIEAVFRAGDCRAARAQVADAIFDGHRLAREIDSADPEVPLPWIREHRALGTTDNELDDIVTDRVPVKPRSTVVDAAQLGVRNRVAGMASSGVRTGAQT